MFARRGAPAQNAAALAGALLPDLSVFVMYFWSRLIEGEPAWRVWGVTYWSEPWQTISAVSNSFPLWAVITAIGLATRSYLMIALGGAGLLHLALDFPVHHDDAHVHFWPFTDWRFHSPLSYWNSQDYGDYVGAVEVALALALIVVLLRRFPERWVRIALAGAFVSYAAVPAYFWFTLG